MPENVNDPFQDALISATVKQYGNCFSADQLREDAVQYRAWADGAKVDELTQALKKYSMGGHELPQAAANELRTLSHRAREAWSVRQENDYLQKQDQEDIPDPNVSPQNTRRGGRRQDQGRT